MNNYLSIKILTSSGFVEIGESVDINSIRIQDRADLAFVRGGFKFLSTTIDKNLAPYTLCRIATLIYNESLEEYEEKNVETFCATSTMTKNFTKGVYIHDVTLLSAESLLELYILGSKAFTEESNYNVIDKTIDFINNKYNINLDFLDNMLLNGSSDYTFGTGTTTKIALPSFLKLPSLGELTAVSSPSFKITIVVEPPPSKLNAVVQP